MRSLREILTSLEAGAHPDARAIKIYRNENAAADASQWPFVAVNPGESAPLAITDDERALLVNNQATYDDRQWYPTAS